MRAPRSDARSRWIRSGPDLNRPHARNRSPTRTSNDPLHVSEEHIERQIGLHGVADPTARDAVSFDISERAVDAVDPVVDERPVEPCTRRNLRGSRSAVVALELRKRDEAFPRQEERQPGSTRTRPVCSEDVGCVPMSDRLSRGPSVSSSMVPSTAVKLAVQQMISTAIDDRSAAGAPTTPERRRPTPTGRLLKDLEHTKPSTGQNVQGVHHRVRLWCRSGSVNPEKNS